MRDAYYDPEHWASAHLIDVTWTPLKGWIITALDVNKGFRGQGHGRALLQRILNDADAEGVHLYLGAAAVEGDGLTQEELCAFYERYGFVNDIADDPNAYHRRPKCPSNTPMTPSN